MEAQLDVEPDRRRGNRRTERRYRCFRGARIVFNGGFAVFDCVIRNISRSGAMLEMETLLGIPKQFQLNVGFNEPLKPCAVRWRTDHRMGVSFGHEPHAAAA